MSEQDLPVFGAIKDDAVIKTNPFIPHQPNLRPPIKVSLGCHMLGVSMPHVDHTDVHTVIAGVKKRFACKPPTPEQEILLRLKTYVYLWCCTNLVPLSPTTDLSVENWLEKTTYSRTRKNELIRKWAECGGVLKKKHYIVKSFVKDESYPEYKHARWINSRTDEFKCAVGPTFKAIEKEVFQSTYFIKKIAVKDRAKYIYENVYRLGAKYICTDYTAFESHFTAELFEACEFVLYDYMTMYLPNKDEFSYYMRHVIAGMNKCVSKLVTVKVPATRMSGEMNTSLGNGFANLMFMLFLCKEKGCTNVMGVIEGDDGLFVMDGPHPTAADFLRLGLTIKMQVFDDLAKASFCGLVFSTTDLINIADPIKILAQTGFTSQQYVFSKSRVLRGLLKAKAFSLLYQYPGCPVIANFAKYLLRVLVNDYVYFRKSSVGDYIDLYQHEAFTFYQTHSDVLDVETGVSTRMLMEETFGVSVAQQLHLENYFDNLLTVTVLDDSTLLSLVPLVWIEYAHEYMRVAPLEPFLISHFYD